MFSEIDGASSAKKTEMAAAGDDGITHRVVEVNGVRLHVAEAGPAGGPVVLLLHGFPELWYTWRHQMPALAAAGYRAVAPDLRGYGGSDAPAAGPEKYTALHVVGDLVALVDSLGHDRVFVVAHDWGAILAWHLCLFRPDKESGAMEAEFARLGTELVLRKFLAGRSADPLFIPYSGWGSPDDKVPLPSWISDEDIKYYIGEFDRTGFTGALNYYRAWDKTWEQTAPWTGAEIRVPVKFAIGDLDLTYRIPWTQDFICKGDSNKSVPLLDGVVIMKDVGHFINEEKPNEINELIINFIKKFS